MKGRTLSLVLVSAVLAAFGCDGTQSFAPDASDVGLRASRDDDDDDGPSVERVVIWQELTQTGGPASQEVVDGVLELRGSVFEGRAFGDIVGQTKTLTNADIDLATGGGTAWGTFTITSRDDDDDDDDDDEGGWKGTFSGDLTPIPAGGTFFDGTGQARGTGDNRGKILQVSFTDSCDDGCRPVAAPGSPELYKLAGVIIDADDDDDDDDDDD